MKYSITISESKLRLTITPTDLTKQWDTQIVHLKINKHEEIGFPFTLLVLLFQLLLVDLKVFVFILFLVFLWIYKIFSLK